MTEIKFLEIKDAEYISKVIEIAILGKIPVILWIKSQDTRFQAVITENSQISKKLFIQLPMNLSSRQIEDDLNRAQSEEIHASFPVKGEMFFFRTRFIPNKDPGVLHLDIPISVYRLQRRSSLRITIPKTLNQKVTFRNPSKYFLTSSTSDPARSEQDLLAFRLLDVSVGGLAFASPLENQPIFSKGTKIKEIHFKLKNYDFMVNAVVIHSAKSENEQGKPILKVGVQFSKLDELQEKNLHHIVMEESQRLFGMLK